MRVGGGVFGVRARLEDQESQLCGVSEVNSELLLTLSFSDSGFGFSFLFAFFGLFSNNLRHCALKYFNF